MAGHKSYSVHMPCHPKATVYPNLAQDEYETKALSRQAAADWDLFLKLRARELCNGVVILLGVKMHFEGKYYADDSLDDACRNFVHDGKIKEADLENMTVPLYFRTSDEIRKPFLGPHSRTVSTCLHLKVDYILNRVFIGAWLEEFMKESIPGIRNVTEAFLHSGMTGDSHVQKEVLK